MELPSENVRTLCEINSQLYEVATSSRALSAPACPDIDVKPAETSHPDLAVTVVRCPGGEWPDAYDEDDGTWRTPGASLSLLSSLKQLRNKAASLPLLLQASNAPAHALAKPVAWHFRKDILAAADSSNGVQIYDFTGHVPVLGQPLGNVPSPLGPQTVLRHELQRDVCTLQWRPNAGLMLAAGGAHGVCLWHLGKPSGARSGTSAGQAASLTWLQCPGGADVSCLAWDPQGRLLAGAGSQVPGLFVWDVATGACIPLRAGLDPVSLLRWSSCGSYLFTGLSTGGFRIWETSTWWSAHWGTAKSAGTFVDAAWGPDGKSLLLVYSRQVSMLHLTGDPPSLTAQILPAVLPGLDTYTDAGNEIVAAAWDTQGKRLALALKGAGAEGTPSSPCVAVYDARCDPLLTTRLIGVARTSPLGGAAGSDDEGDWEMVRRSGSGEIDEAEGSARPHQGGGDKGAAPVELQFHADFNQGALLAVRQGDRIATVPMYFAS